MRVMELRFGGTELFCAGCVAKARFHPVRGRRAFACQTCGHHIFPCVGTVFERSRTPLVKWLRAIGLTTASRQGVTAKELQRQLGVTYKTAWRMQRDLRRVMASAAYRGALASDASADRAALLLAASAAALG